MTTGPGLRARLMLLVAGAMLPAMVIIGLFAAHTQSEALKAAEAGLGAQAQLVAGSQERLVVRTRQLLSDLAGGPSIRNVGLGLCSRYLANLLALSEVYTNMGVAGLDGQVRCHALPDNPRHSLAGQPAFESARTGDGFTVGNLVNPGATGQPMLAFAVPVLSDQGERNGVAFASLGLPALAAALNADGLPAGVTAVVIDADARVLASRGPRAPGVGSHLALPALQQHGAALPRQADDGMAYALAMVAGTQGRLRVLLWVPRASLVVGPLQTLELELGALALLFILALGVAWRLGQPEVSRLEAERQRLELIVNNMRGGVIAASQSGEFLLLNDMARDMLPGLSSHADMGASARSRAMQLFQADGVTPVPPHELPLESGLRGEVHNGREYWLHAEGRPPRLHSTHSRPLMDAQGRIMGALVVFDDITEARATERQRDEAMRSLEVSRRRLLEAQRIGEIGNWEYDIATRTLWWSDQLYAIFGRTPGTGGVSEKEFMLGVHPEDRRLVHEAREAVRRGENPPDFMHRVVRPDGSLRWVLETTELVRDATGAVVAVTGVTRDVTARRTAYDALAESEQRYQALFDSSTIAMMVYDTETRRLLDFNQAFLVQYGRSREEALALQVDDLMAPGERENFVAQYGRIRNTHALVSHWRHQRSNGTQLDVEVAVTAVTVQGRPARFAVMHDITARNRAEDALTDFARRVQLVASASLAVTAAPTLADALQQVAQHACAILGVRFARVHLQAQPPIEAQTHEADNPDLAPGDSAAARGAGLDTPLIARDHSTIGALQLGPRLAGDFTDDDRAMAVQLAQLASAAVENARLIQSIRALNAELEHKVEERTRELAHKEAQFRELAEKAPQMVWTVNRKGETLYLNPFWYTMVGGTPEQWLGGHQWYEALHPDDRAEVTRSWLEARARRSGYSGMRRFRSVDGSYRTMAYSATPLFDELGELIGYTGIDTDVTDIKRTQEALQRSNEELEAFSYSVSHDLRSPLRAINGYSLLLQEQLQLHPDPELKAYLDRIADATRKMSALIDGLLSLSQISRSALLRREVDLSALALEAGQACEQAHPERVVQFEVQPGLRALGDARLLQAALHNLVANAWKFTARTPQPRIAVGAHTGPDGGPVFWVRDNGAGFDMEYTGKLFGTFQRLHHASDFPGTGIGLATVRRIVERHGGRIWAEGTPGQGAVFYFTLP